MDEKAKAQALKWAEQLQLRAVKTKDFLTLAKDNTDATTQELVVGKSSTKLEKAALDAALALKKGEVSSVVEGTQGYYIIYCVNDMEEDATQARKEVIIAKRQNRLFQKKYIGNKISYRYVLFYTDIISDYVDFFVQLSNHFLTQFQSFIS